MAKASDAELLAAIKSAPAASLAATSSFALSSGKVYTSAQESSRETDAIDLIGQDGSKEMQTQLARAATDTLTSPASTDGEKKRAGLVVSHMQREFRGEVLDEVAAKVPDSTALGMFPPDYETFKKSFISSWTLSGGTRAYTRAYAALADAPRTKAKPSGWVTRPCRSPSGCPHRSCAEIS